MPPLFINNVCVVIYPLLYSGRDLLLLYFDFDVILISSFVSLAMSIVHSPCACTDQVRQLYPGSTSIFSRIFHSARIKTALNYCN